MKKYILLFALLFSITAFSQTEDFSKPDYRQIEKNVANKKSPYYFESLFDRYNRADSTMTIEEKRHLYYGYSFQPSYSPYSISDSQDELYEILRSEKTDTKTMEKLIKVSEKVLKDFPFNIRIKEYRMYAFKQLEKFKEAKVEETQAGIIIDAILSTGDGITKENSFYVISTGNEYEILDILGFRFGGEQQLIEQKYDYLTLAENSYNINGFYFDVTRLFESFKP
ncbi:DUF4919 domain-containing protein [Flavobacterium sp. NRK1]|uniref:DUF4919 domain-containing protein n=1 Tax=Flavobacterium sp. NRK1 TaxID=2954929 RepID=UPI002092CCA7|nr:DUF4919 domain-containing protein [Flavobacterium sp. NRK1]MCO6146610.1 DUF4919 domain-containing protein [Flavobacterium sp. NRK1]